MLGAAPDPRRTIVEVEVFLAGAAILLVLQLIFGLCRRLSSSIWVQGGVWLAYTLSFPLVTYTFGLMQSSPTKNKLYPVWAVSLFLLAGSTNSVTAYDLDENKQWKKQLFELGHNVYIVFLLLYSNLVMWDSRQFNPILESCYVLLVIITFTNLLRVIACWMATSSDPSKVVADYMRDEVDSENARLLQGSESDPSRMKGGRYLVRWYAYFLNTDGAGADTLDCRTKLEEEDIITVEMIRDRCDDSLVDSNGVSQPEDMCLSFALFHLLKRRFFGIYCHEAGHPGARDFVLNGLLASEDGNRAFRIIEVELAFLHDFFFTKYASIYENEILFFVMFITKTILIVILGVLFVHHSFLSIETEAPIIVVETTEVDAVITVAVLGALLVVEILQTMLYLASDWALVSLACYYVRKARPCQAFMYYLLRRPIYILRKKSLFKYWQNMLGQYSVIDGSRLHITTSAQARQPKVKVLLLFILVKLLSKVLMLVRCCKEFACKARACRLCDSIEDVRLLTDGVKREIASSLKCTVHDHLTNGEASLRRNGVLEHFGWALSWEDRNITDILLIWHIATNCCEIVLRHEAETELDSARGKLKHYSEVATSLSRYSVYLMASAPELLPGNAAETSFAFDKVMQEATEALYPGQENDNRGRAKVDRDLLWKAYLLLQDQDQENRSDNIFLKGLKLWRELEDIYDGELRWKVMAEFWAEIILYVTMSHHPTMSEATSSISLLVESSYHTSGLSSPMRASSPASPGSIDLPRHWRYIYSI